MNKLQNLCEEYLKELFNKTSTIEIDQSANIAGRMSKFMTGMLSGYQKDAKSELGEIFCDSTLNDLIILKDLKFYSMCAHHFLPFFGHISIGYIPKDGYFAGLSGIARLINCFSNRLQTQEKLCNQIASELEKLLKPKGLIVVIKATHLCLNMRNSGNIDHSSSFVTSSVRGILKDNEKSREEFLSLIKG